MTKVAVVNKSKGLFLPSNLRAQSQMWAVMVVIHNPCAHDKSPCLSPEFVQLSDLARLVTPQRPVVIYCTEHSAALWQTKAA